MVNGMAAPAAAGGAEAAEPPPKSRPVSRNDAWGRTYDDHHDRNSPPRPRAGNRTGPADDGQRRHAVPSAAPPPNEAFTPASSTPTLASLKKYYDIPNFRIGGTYDLDAEPETWRDGGQGGTTLESLGSGPLKTAYIDVGTPIRNDAGEIINAIIISPYYSGDSTAIYSYWMPWHRNALAGGADDGPGLVIDTNKYYVVFLDSLGLWGTSKPSEGLGRNFPQYSYFDMVQANYQLLRDHLNVANVHLAIGVRWEPRKAGSGARCTRVRRLRRCDHADRRHNGLGR